MAGNRRCSVLLVIVLWVSICQSANGDPPMLDIVLKRAGDSATVTEEAGRVVVTVTSGTGIGQMTLAAKGRWPKDVTLRLRYRHEKPFKTLEGFEMTSSRMQVRTNSGQSGKTPFFLSADDGTFPRDDLQPSGWLKLDIKPNGDALDLRIPSNLWREEKEVRIQWIDFYRS